MDVQLPDGRVLTGIPEGTTKAQIEAKLGMSFSDQQPQSDLVQQDLGIIGNRQAQIEDLANQAVSGTISTPESVVRGGLKAAQIPFDIANEYVTGPVLNKLTDWIGQGVAAVGEDNVLGDAAIGLGNLAGSAAQGINQFQQEHPVAAGRIGSVLDVGNIVAPFMPLSSGKSLANTVADATKSTGKAVAKGTGSALMQVPGVVPKADSALVNLAERAQQLDIPLRLDQVSPTRVRKTLQKVSQEIPLSGAKAFEDSQRSAWNTQLANRAIGQSDLTPESINKFLSEANTKFSQAIGEGNIPFDVQALNTIKEEAGSNITEELSSIVGKNVDKLADQIVDGQIDANKLSTFRSQLVKRIPKVSGEAKVYLGDLVDTIDETVGKSIGPDQQQLLQQARKEWRNYRTIEPLLEKSTDGMIEPTQLMQRVATSPYIKASRTSVGEDDLVDLARIGKEFLPKAGGSDTAQKIGLLTLGGGLAADPISTGGLGLLTIGGNRALQSLNTSQKAVAKSLRKEK